METSKINELRKTVVRGAQEIYNKGLVEDGEGNVSVRINKNEILTTPTSTKYSLLSPELIVHMDLEGNVLGSGKFHPRKLKCI